MKGLFLGTYNAWDLASGQPSNTNQRQDCVVVRASSGLWHDVLCSKVADISTISTISTYR